MEKVLGEMSSIKHFFKSSIVYFIGNVLTKVMSFFLLPLYTYRISTEDMGYYDLSTSYLNILIPVICMEIWTSIMRYMFDFYETKGKYKAIFNGLLIFGGSVIVYTLLFVVLGLTSNIQCLILIFFYGIFTMLQNIYTSIARGLEYNTTFVISGIVGSLVNFLSNIIMILGLNMTLNSLYIAMIIGLVVQILILEGRIHLFRHLSFQLFDWDLLKSMLRYSIPLSVNSACFWFLTSYNRVGVSNVLGLSANGVYSVAARFTSVLSLVSTCFNMAWQELVYAKGNDGDRASFYSEASDYYIQFLLIGIVLCIPAVKVVFPFMVAPEYEEAFTFIPLYLLATGASIFSSFIGNIFCAEKDTKVILVSTLAGAIVNVGILHALIGRIGIQAANVSLLCGFLVNIAFRIFFLRRSLSYHLNWGKIILPAVLFGVAWFLYLTQGTVANILFAVMIVIVFAFLYRDIVGRLLKGLKNSVKQKTN